MVDRLVYSYEYQEGPQTFCINLNCAVVRGMECCFACGKDLTEIVTEIQSFADGKPLQRKERTRVLNTW